jgi:hypothetical protein
MSALYLRWSAQVCPDVIWLLGVNRLVYLEHLSYIVSVKPLVYIGFIL